MTKPRVETIRDRALPGLCRDYLAAAAARREAEKAERALKGEILGKLGGRLVAQAAGWLMRVIDVAPSLGTLVTTEMVGTRVGARAGYAKLEVLELTPAA